MLMYKYYSYNKQRLEKYKKSIEKTVGPNVQVTEIKTGDRHYFGVLIDPTGSDQDSILLFNMDIDDLSFCSTTAKVRAKEIEDKCQ